MGTVLPALQSLEVISEGATEVTEAVNIAASLQWNRGWSHRALLVLKSRMTRQSVIQATVLTNPVWVLKTRFQLQENQALVQKMLCSRKGVPAVMKSRYGSLRQAVQIIAREEGLRGFYRGIGPSLLMVTPDYNLSLVPTDVWTVCQRSHTIRDL